MTLKTVKHFCIGIPLGFVGMYVLLHLIVFILNLSSASGGYRFVYPVIDNKLGDWTLYKVYNSDEYVLAIHGEPDGNLRYSDEFFRSREYVVRDILINNPNLAAKRITLLCCFPNSHNEFFCLCTEVKNCSDWDECIICAYFFGVLSWRGKAAKP